MKTPPLPVITRRRFLRQTAGAAGALTLGGVRPLQSNVATPTLPDPALSGIKHVIVVMMENRSFDHFLGWLPGADGRQAGLTFADSNGFPHATHPLAPDYQGCGQTDPDHSYEGGRVEYNNGACDGWRLNGANADDDFSIGYYQENDLAFFGPASRAWTVCDRYFAGILAETYPNRFHMHAAQTDRLHNNTNISTLPTIWDRLASHGLSGRYYYSDIPFLALWGTKYLGISKPFSQFLTDARTGLLPNVSFIDPRFEDETSGTSGDDHPYSDVRNGEAFLNQIYNAVVQSPNWSSTVLVINYDEWGGFFDHVPPPLAPIPPATAAAGLMELPAGTAVDGRLGFRTPNLVISPWSRRGVISSEQFDHTSVLRMIEWRFGLAPLTVRDQTANNLADVLDFSSPKNLYAPAFSVPTGPAPGVPFGTPCQPATPAAPIDVESAEFAELAVIARTLGFPTPAVVPLRASQAIN